MEIIPKLFNMIYNALLIAIASYQIVSVALLLHSSAIRLIPHRVWGGEKKVERRNYSVHVMWFCVDLFKHVVRCKCTCTSL